MPVSWCKFYTNINTSGRGSEFMGFIFQYNQYKLYLAILYSLSVVIWNFKLRFQYQTFFSRNVKH